MKLLADRVSNTERDGLTGESRHSSKVIGTIEERLASAGSQPRNEACMGTGEDVRSESMMLLGYESTIVAGVDESEERL
jgi:hypothetical protein